MTTIYEYRKLGPYDDYEMIRDGVKEQLDNYTQVIELLGTALFLGKTVERTDFDSNNMTVWVIK